MTREAAVLVMVAAAVVFLGLMLWGWRRRVRRDSGLVAPFGTPGVRAKTLATRSVLYVATTEHERPLERLAVRGLGYRARGDVQVTSEGIVLALDGQDPILIAPDRVVDIGQSSVVIDRVVEPDGLVRLAWRLTETLVVDSFLRPQDVSARALADEIRGAVPATDGIIPPAKEGNA